MTGFRSRTFTEYVQILWRRKLMIFLIAAGMLISTFLIIDRLPDIYESKATVVTSGLQADRQAVNSRVAATTERLTSRSFLEPVIERNNPYNGSGVESALARMRDDIKIDTFYRSDYPERITVAYRHRDPRVAREVASDLVGAFGKVNEAIEKQSADNASSLASEIAEVENRLRDMGKLRSAIASRQGALGRAAGEASAARAQRIAAASSIETLTDKAFSLEQQTAEQKRQIGEQEKIAKQAPSDAKSSSSYGVLLVRKAELESQLKDYATQYTDKNPKFIHARTQLDEINHQISQLNAGGDAQSGPVNSAEARELRSMQRELVRMQTELSITQRELERKKQGSPAIVASAAAPPPITTVVSGGEAPSSGSLQPDYETLRKRYENLLDRQDALGRTQVAAAGLDPGIFQIVDMPAEPKLPVGPNRMKYRMFALALSVGLALLIAMAVEIPKLYSITDDRDVEYYLGVPVIALIPESAGSTEHQPRRLLLGRALSTLLLLGLVSVVIFLVSYLHLFKLAATLLR